MLGVFEEGSCGGAVGGPLRLSRLLILPQRGLARHAARLLVIAVSEESLEQGWRCAETGAVGTPAFGHGWLPPLIEMVHTDKDFWKDANPCASRADLQVLASLVFGFCLLLNLGTHWLLFRNLASFPAELSSFL